MKSYLICLAFLATAVSTAWGGPLEPISSLSIDRRTENLAHFVPSTNINLHYDLGPHMDSHGIVDITLKKDHPAVLLENIGAVKVTCESSIILIAFNDTATFLRSMRDWPHGGGFVLVTNHLGSCDIEHERGFYWVSSLGWNNDLMVIAARAEKTDIASIATSIQVDFSRNGTRMLPSQKPTVDQPGVNIEANVSVPTTSETFWDPPYFNVTAKDVHLSNNVTFWGHLSYDIPSHQLEALWFDINASFISELALAFNFTGPTNTTDYVFPPDPVRFNVLDIPNIITISPVFLWSIGAAVKTSNAASVSTNVTVAIPDGVVHVDFVDNNNTQATGWTPQLNSTVSSTNKVKVHIAPFVNSTVELELNILNGVYYFASGVTAKATIFNEITALRNQTKRGIAGGMIWKGNSTCNNGLDIRSSLGLAVDAFVTDWWQDTVYSVDIPIGEECF